MDTRTPFARTRAVLVLQALALGAVAHAAACNRATGSQSGSAVRAEGQSQNIPPPPGGPMCGCALRTDGGGPRSHSGECLAAELDAGCSTHWIPGGPLAPPDLPA